MDPLRKSLLLGLDQSPPGAGTAPVGLPEATPAWQAWLQAGADAIYRNAALTPLSGIPQAPPAPIDPRPVLDPALGAVLALALHHGNAPLLEELAQGMARHGQRVSAGDLPALLKQRDPEMRQAARPLLGDTGLWLAGQGDWSWAFGEAQVDPEALWDDGGPAERLQALEHFRREDAQGARERLVASFAGDGAAERLVLLEALQVGLSLADQDLLRHLISSDRSKKVKARARALLLRLACPLREELAAFVGAHLHIEKAFSLRGQKVALQVELPQAWPEELSWVLEHKNPRLGKLASGWEEALARLPLSLWTAHGPALSLVAALDPSEDMATAIGWTRAALDQGAQDWVFPLYQFWAGAMGGKGGLAREAVDQIRLLAPALPLERASDLMCRLLAKADGADPGVATALLSALPTPWPEAVARAWLGRIARAQQVRDLPRWLAQSLKAGAMALPPHLLPQRPMLPGSRTTAVIAFAATLTARRRIHTLLP